jgi:hypothetical protein
MAHNYLCPDATSVQNCYYCDCGISYHLVVDKHTRTNGTNDRANKKMMVWIRNNQARIIEVIVILLGVFIEMELICR